VDVGSPLGSLRRRGEHNKYEHEQKYGHEPLHPLIVRT
jgi:hypothetical protein